MMLRSLLFCLLFLAPLTSLQADNRIDVYFFYSASCRDCIVLKDSLLEALAGQFRSELRFHAIVLDSEETFQQFQELAGIHNDAIHDYPVLVARHAILQGFHNIRTGATEFFQSASRGQIDHSSPSLTKFGTAECNFHLSLILLAGLADGVNPCAFATLILLISLLACLKLSEAQTRRIIFGYSAGIFLSYYAIGLGLLKLLQGLEHIISLQPVHYLAAFLCLLAAILQAMDAWRARNGENNVIHTALPAVLRQGIHALLTRHLDSRTSFVSALLLGSLVAVLEGICTGQVYLPTLMIILRDNPLDLQALLLLLLYNLAFILPLVILAFVLLRMPRVWNRLRLQSRLRPYLHLAMALLFLLLASYLLIA